MPYTPTKAAAVEMMVAAPKMTIEEVAIPTKDMAIAAMKTVVIAKAKLTRLVVAVGLLRTDGLSGGRGLADEGFHGVSCVCLKVNVCGGGTVKAVWYPHGLVKMKGIEPLRLGPSDGY